MKTLSQLGFDIGRYFYEEGKSLEAIKHIKFNDITLNDKEIIIECQRPGLLIGKGGKQIDDLIEYLKQKGYTQKIRIIESKEKDVLQCLYGVYYYGEYDNLD